MVKCWKLGALCTGGTFKRWSLVEGGTSWASMGRDSGLVPEMLSYYKVRSPLYYVPSANECFLSSLCNVMMYPGKPSAEAGQMGWPDLKLSDSKTMS
jgi:hypothetical protein